MDNPTAYSLTEAELETRLQARLGKRTSTVLQSFRCCYPGAQPAYVYLFAYRTPVLDGRPGAFHSAEIAFVFNNLDRCDQLTGGDPQAATLAEMMSGAWVNFARTGDPNGGNLPHWPAFTPTRRTTLVFDTTCAARDDFDGEALKSLPVG